MPTSWPSIVKQESESLKINLDNLIRKNLSDIAFVTIDGEDAKDFDDAVFCVEHDYGYDLYVAIADVSLYVKPGSSIDKEAINRGTSIYFPNFVIPMLPEILSNNLCSLKPNEDRPSLVVKINLDKDCCLKKYNFFSAIIHSHARLTYTEVENNSFKSPLSDAVIDSLKNLKSLAHKRIEIKDKRGAVRIHSKEHLIKINDDGTSKAISFRKNIFANQMIEECMLLANECAADLLNNRFGYAPFRVHEEPDQLKLETLKKILGGDVQLQNPRDPASQINSISEKISAKDQLKQSLILQSMKRAEYSTENVGHFGLQLDQYCHFTSPIRRYPDLLTHRMIKSCIEDDNNYSSYKKNDQEICEISSKLEHRAEKASRKVNQILIFDYLKRHLGESFEGVISGVTEFGLFITLEKFLVSGLLHVADLKRDRYQLSKDQTYLYGIKSGRRYRFGDSINIKIVAVSPFEGKMTLLQNEHKRRRKREGFHVVDALLRHSPETIKKIFIPDSRNDERLSSLVSVAESLSINVEVNKKIKQHPIAKITPQPTLGNKDLKEFIESSATENPTLFIVDNIIDPRNLGACIRSAIAANVDAIIINKHQCSPITSTVRKVSCGGTEVGSIFMVSNLINVIKFLKDQGIEIIGTSEHSEDIYTSMDFNTPLALIVGSEETGIRQKTLDACNHVVNLSDSELINSLNVSVASGVVLFEIKKHKSSL